MSGLDVLGATASILQIGQFVCKLGQRMLAKPNDDTALTAIREDAQKYVKYVKEWEEKMEINEKALDACQCLRRVLEEVVTKMDRLRDRKKSAKPWTYFELYSDGFQSKFNNALQKFNSIMCAESQILVCKMDAKLQEIIKEMKGLEITAKQLDRTLGTEDDRTALCVKITGLSQGLEVVQREAQQIKRTVEELQVAVLSIRKDGDATREIFSQQNRSLQENIDNIGKRVEILTEKIADSKDPKLCNCLLYSF